ncbi:MAG TPA: GAF domain-containing protein [bacterium]|nr:GAF domain-containing protein [bacterium]
MDTSTPSLSERLEYLQTIFLLIESSLKQNKTPELSPENWGEMRDALGAVLQITQRPGSLQERLQQVEKERDVVRELLEVTNLRMEQQVDQLSLLRLIYDVVAQAVLLNDPFRFLLQQIVTVTNAENGSIMLLDESKEKLILQAAAGTKDFAPQGVCFNVGEGIAGLVAQRGQAQVISDTLKDPIYKGLGHHQESIKSLICMPLICHREILGVLNLSSSRVDAFSQNMYRFLQVVAGYLAMLVIETRENTSEA